MTCQSARQAISLVISAQNLSRPVKWNRNQHIRFVQKPPNANLSQHLIGQYFRDRPAVVIFHPMNRLPQRIAKSPHGHYSFKRVDSRASAARTGAAQRKGCGTALARMRGRQRGKFFPTFRTKRGVICGRPATNAARRIDKVRHVLEKAKQHGHIVNEPFPG